MSFEGELVSFVDVPGMRRGLCFEEQLCNGFLRDRTVVSTIIEFQQLVAGTIKLGDWFYCNLFPLGT